jgi:hypothetical protein
MSPKQLLLAALRSGEFNQCQDMMHNSSGEFDALGVACEVYRRTTSDGKWSGVVFFVGDDNRMFILPDVVREWYGWSDSTGDNGLDIPKMNDTGSTFKEIADAIEATE